MTPEKRALYLAIMACALLVGSALARRSQNKATLGRAQRLAVSIGAVVGGTFAAKVPFFVMDPGAFASGAAWLEGEAGAIVYVAAAPVRATSTAA